MSAVTQKVPRNPAPFSQDLYPVFAKLIDEYARPRRGATHIELLDPFAGVGGVHRLQDEHMTHDPLHTHGVELMPRWADAHERTVLGDSTLLTDMYPPSYFDVILSSPTYGNRFADHHNAKDTCKRCDGTGVDPFEGDPFKLTVCKLCKGTKLSPRRSYKHFYEETGGDFFAEADPTNNTGAMHWGPEYQRVHREVFAQMRAVLRRGGIVVWNVGDFNKTLVRGGKPVRQGVSAWHRRTLIDMGFELLRTRRVKTPGFRHGAHHDSRTPFENVYVMRKR